MTRVHCLFTFEQLQAHVGGAEVTADADEVGGLGSIAIDNIHGTCLADGSDADGKTGEAACGVTSHKIYMVFLTCQKHSAVQCLDVLNTEALRHGKTYGDLTRCAHHGVDIAQVYHYGFVTKMLERCVLEVEMYALHEQVGGYQHAAFACVLQYGTIVANATYCASVLGLYIFGESLY